MRNSMVKSLGLRNFTVMKTQPQFSQENHEIVRIGMPAVHTARSSSTCPIYKSLTGGCRHFYRERFIL